jgi:3-oxoacyl-[acyl-carrier protein] reductase
MDLGLSGKTALVNGGSAGLGRASALSLAREGAHLFVSARGEERLRLSCDGIQRETGVRVVPIVADHSTPEGRRKILDLCPSPDILVCSATPPRLVMDFRDVAESEIREAIETGFMSPIGLMLAVIGGMVERNWGRVVNITSSAVKYPMQLRLLSGAPRAALVNYTVAISKMVASRNVTINTLLPALHATEGARSIIEPMANARGVPFEDEVSRQVAQLQIPAGRFGHPHEFGDIVAWFCSAQSSYVTGQSLVVDGGLSTSIF